MTLHLYVQIALKLKDDNDHQELARILAADDVAAFQKLTAERVVVTGADRVGSPWTTLLEAAADTDAIEIAQFCLQQGAKIGPGVMRAVHHGRAKRIYSMLCSRSDIEMDEIWDTGQMDALNAAVIEKDAELVKFWLVRGYHPDDSNGYAQWAQPPTLLGMAASESSLEVVKLLVEAGNRKWDTGALQHAVDENRIDIVEYLLGQGFDPNELGPKDEFDARCNVKMGTPLHRAIEGGHAELFELLINKTDLTVRDGTGRTPLELAEERGLAQFAERLKEKTG